MTNEKLFKIYTDICEQGAKEIRNGNVLYDSFLSNLENDKRLGLSAIISINDNILGEISEIIDRIKEIEPYQFYYPQSDFHITVFDFISGTEDFDRKKIEQL